jgi:hypothetical protein
MQDRELQFGRHDPATAASEAKAKSSSERISEVIHAYTQRAAEENERPLME